MKTWLLVLLAVVVGTGFGVATAVYNVRRAPWDGTPNGLGSPIVAAKPAGGPEELENVPAVAVDQDSYDFGVMDGGGKQSHMFRFTNRGGAKLTLAKGDVTCRCTKFELEKEELQPGQSAAATVEWTPKGFRGPFRQTAVVLTNDPSRPRVTLTIVGRVTNIVKADPNDLILDGVPSGGSRSVALAIFAYTPKPLKVLSHEFLEPETAQSFTAKFETMREAQWKGEQDAQGGVVGEIALKPGLPVGSFRQTIRIKTSYGAVGEIEVPIKGTVVGDISLSGADWNSQRGVLTMGTVNGSEGAERTLLLILRGDHRKGVTFGPIRSSPDFLQVELGQAKEVEDRPLVHVPLTIRIPKGSPPTSHLGLDLASLGRITIKTNHPQVPELVIYVRFAVQG